MMKNKRKVSAIADSHEGAKRPNPRQDPVSCQSCRKRKLKCNRHEPCSNCLSRRIACTYYANPLPSCKNVTSSIIGVVTGVTGENAASSSLVNNNTASSQAITTEESRINVSHENLKRPPEIIEHERTADWLEKIMVAPRVPDALPKSFKDKLITTSYAAFLSSNLTAFLPRETEANALFNYYVDHISYLYHIIIPGRVQTQMNAIYESVHHEQSSSSSTETRIESVNLNHLALLFSIFAAVSYFEHLAESTNNTASISISEKRCREYTTLVAAALMQSDYINYPTVEGLQAAVIVSQIVSNNGLDSSVRVFFHMGALVNQCRSMGLLQLDSATNKERRMKHGFDPVVLELKRRLVWSVISTDWLLSYLGGPQEGSYLVQPAHIAVEYPANVFDGDIGMPGCEQNLPENVPTVMTYFISRIKLSEFCREVTDATCRERLLGIDVPYSKIMELDRKWNEYYEEMPAFFRMDSFNRRKYAQLYEDCPQISWQRLLCQQGYQTRLCRLHRSYFIRGARDPKYSYSHIVCLNSARRVIEITRIMNSEYPNTSTISLTWSVIHHEFMAAVVLLMDVCFNWDDILAERRKEEVIEACRMLDKAQRSSKLVREGINALMDVLRSHWVPYTSDQLPPPVAPQLQQRQDKNSHVGVTEGEEKELENASAPTPAAVSKSWNNAETETFSSAHAVDETLDLENLWSGFLHSSAMMASGPDDWMGLLSDLNDITPSLPGRDSTYC